MKAKKNKTRDPRSVLFAIAVTILGIIFAAMVLLFAARIREHFYYYTAEPNDILRELNRGDLVDAWRDARENRAAGLTAEKDPDYTLPYAAADYFEAASYYEVFRENGDEEMAEVYRNKMDAAREDMGELAYLSDEIDALFG